ncbi:hypothetical protein [Pontibacter beigongshangensis]|nr:hypothetical protein [Pontibacter beigongshangensis]
MTEDEKRPYEEDKPPLLGSWKQLYLLVLGNLALTIFIFYLITRFYA